jgi:hypothetical protein
MRHITDRSSDPAARTSGRLDHAIAGLLAVVFIGAFTLHPLLVAVPSAACFVLGLLDWRHPWRVDHLDLLALAGFFPVAMLISDDLSPAGLWLAAVCLGWLFTRLGQRPGCGAGQLARRLASAAWPAPARSAVLVRPWRVPDLPPGLVRPVFLLRLPPVRGHLPGRAGPDRDATAGRVFRPADPGRALYPQPPSHRRRRRADHDSPPKTSPPRTALTASGRPGYA